MLKARCPSCGKSTVLEETDAGLPVVCLACGSRYVAPELVPTAAAGASTTNAGAAGRTGPRVGRTFWVASGLGLVAAVVAVALLMRGLPDPIDAATARSLASQAQAATADGRLADAHKKYHELETIIDGRTVRDPEVRQLVEQAMAEKQRVYAQLLDQVARDKRAAATQLAATAPSTPPATTGPALAANEPPAPATGPSAAAPAPAETVAATSPAPTTTEATVEAPVADGPPAVAAAETRPPPATLTATTTPTTRAAVAMPRPAIQPMPEPREGVTDEEIGRAIALGVDHLLSRFDKQRAVLEGVDIGNADGGGQNALAVYALMQCGQAISDERLNVRGPQMNEMIEGMKASRLRRGRAQTYATGIRATALALFNRPQDRDVLKQDVLALVQSHSQGAYSYEVEPARGRQRYKQQWDNSNSQYGLLGVWAGAESDIEVPTSYWAAVDDHWTGCQLEDGQWSYAGDRGGRISMTAAGIASLFVTHDWLDAPKYGKVVGREPFSPSLQRALTWFETGDHAVDVNSSYWGYTLYGIERVGLASGFKYFGQRDWYRHMAADVIARQAADGSWGDTIDTSFALLFLARGRHPILMNKVRFGGYWANRPRDAANLTRHAARQLERELNWQVVPLRSPKGWTDWLDSPILYVASHEPPALMDEDVENIRQYVAAGGLLFTHADGESAAFNQFAQELAAKLFPRYEMKDLPADHELYKLVYKIDDAHRPPLKAVTNGSRLLMVHSPVDIARSWQLRDTKTYKGFFQLGVNLFLYTTGRRDLRNRLESTFVSDPGDPVAGSVAVARLKYAGNWDPEPAAWPRFGRWFQRQTGTGVNLAVMKMSDLKPGAAAVAHLTGNTRQTFSDEEVAAAKAFVDAGGVLLIDQTGGTGPFDQSVLDNLLAKAFPGAEPKPLNPAAHPLFRGGVKFSGMDDLSKPRLRAFPFEGRGNEAAPLSGFGFGAGHVVFTPYDVTSGLLGSRTWGIAGLHPDYAPPLMKNLLFWTLDGQHDE